VLRGGLVEGHVYTAKQIDQLRKLLGASEREWPDDKLFRETDLLAAMMGFHIARDPQKTISKRIADIQKNILIASEELLGRIEDKEYAVEFSFHWGGYAKFEPETLCKQLRQFIVKTNKHIESLRKESRRGRSWDSGLKDHFVDLVSMLCEYIDPNFEPHRNVQEGSENVSQFGGAIDLLGPTLFRHYRSNQKPQFHGAIRRAVDNWNYAKRELVDDMRRRGLLTG
jgi:hypothetical protein